MVGKAQLIYSSLRYITLTPLRRSVYRPSSGIYNPYVSESRVLLRLADGKGGPVGKEIVSVCSPSELGESIPFTTLHFSEYTMDLAYNADTVFTNLFLVAAHGSLCPIIAKLGGDSLQLATVSFAFQNACSAPC